MKKTVLVTGCAGFIGYHLTNRLLKEKYTVVGIDNINNYYSTKLKKDRVKQIKINDKSKKFYFYRCNLKDFNKQKKLFKKYKPNYVINLAAQAGVRYSIENPMAYVDSNLVGFTNILELSRHFNVKHLIYASTSSVYGASKKYPYNENDLASHPIAFYGATKRANELMAHSYSYLYKLPTTGLRFFTVYGPWGRPDMALFKFVQNIIKNKTINVFNKGKHTRDFTYIDDIVESIIRLVNKAPKSSRNLLFNDPSESSAPFRILNIGNNKPVKLMEYIKEIELQLKIKAKIKFFPFQKGDIQTTFASKKKLVKITGYTPKTNIAYGISKFIEWFLIYYKILNVK